jgi:sec-independent protein translocase protein TatB
MFDIAWGEFIVIGAVALIVIGPKELPSVLRTVGQWTTKIRRMGAEFQNQFQEAMREAEMADLKKDVESLNETTSGFAKFDPAKWQPRDEAHKSAETDSALAVFDDGTTAPPAEAPASEAPAPEAPAPEAPAPQVPPPDTQTPVPRDPAAAPEAASHAAFPPGAESAIWPAAAPDVPAVPSGAGASPAPSIEVPASSGSAAAAAPVGTNGHA